MNKVVLITGGSRGIGRATAYEFASKGYDIAINYVSNDKMANEILSLIEKNFDVMAKLYKADLSSENDIVNLVKKIYHDFGHIDVLVNNAGIAKDCEFFDKKVEDIDKILSVNLIAPYLLAKYIGPKMVEQKYGKIINVSSNNATKCFYPTSADYDMSKAGLNSLTHNMAIEYAPYVNVNAVAPGWVKTDMLDSIYDDPDVYESECQRILKQRFARPEDVAKLIVFLASDDAEYINSEIITIDGGM